MTSKENQKIINKLDAINYMLSQVETKIQVKLGYFGTDGLFFTKNQIEAELKQLQKVRQRIINYFISTTKQLN
jgi:hypothetical protein